MTLLINNDDVKQVLTMDLTLNALRDAYMDLAKGEAVCRPRVDIRIPTSSPERVYQWGTMEGGSTRGYFAIRMKSDIMWEQEYGGTRTREKYCIRPGLFYGLVLLFSIENGEPLAIINDGYLQHLRVAGDAAIGVQLMARKNAAVVGMIGSGGMARSHIEAFTLVRDITRVKVYSPTPEHREAYAREVTETYGIDAVPVSSAEEAHRGVDILAECSDAVVPALFGRWIDPGTHIVTPGSGGMDAEARSKVNRWLRLGTAPAPAGLPDLGVPDEVISYVARAGEAMQQDGAVRIAGPTADRQAVSLADLLVDPSRGRSSDDEITYSERGNIQGAQFYPIAGEIYERAKARGLGREIPTEWFLQDIRD
jgi:ornithine cyclodeaminase/alanine dehydrogenase-like protein (mu-crystallin family)